MNALKKNAAQTKIIARRYCEKNGSYACYCLPVGKRRVSAKS